MVSRLVLLSAMRDEVHAGDDPRPIDYEVPAGTLLEVPVNWILQGRDGYGGYLAHFISGDYQQQWEMHIGSSISPSGTILLVAEQRPRGHDVVEWMVDPDTSIEEFENEKGTVLVYFTRSRKR